MTSWGIYGMLFFVMGMMKDIYIEHLNKIEENLRVTQQLVRDLKQHDFADEDEGMDDFASPTHEDCGYFGYEGLCED